MSYIVHRVLIASAFVLFAPVVAAEGYYLKFFGGASRLADTDISIGSGTVTPNVGFQSDLIGGAALGYAYNDRLAAEVEFSYRSGDSRSTVVPGQYASTVLMLNGVWSFPTSSSVTPYVGAGVGIITEIDFDVSGGSAPGEYSDREGLAAQVFAGVTYPIGDRLSVFGEIRYLGTGSQSLKGPGGFALEADYDSVDFLIGGSFRF